MLFRDQVDPDEGVGVERETIDVDKEPVALDANVLRFEAEVRLRLVDPAARQERRGGGVEGEDVGVLVSERELSVQVRDIVEVDLDRRRLDVDRHVDQSPRKTGRHRRGGIEQARDVGVFDAGMTHPDLVLEGRDEKLAGRRRLRPGLETEACSCQHFPPLPSF